MMRLSEQILFLMGYGRKYFPELGELLNKPYQYSSLLPKNGRAVHRALARLKIRGEVAVQGRRDRAHYRVTREGMGRLLEMRPYLAGAKWDRKWRVVVFDIPERYRGMRAVLRRFLSSVGAGAWQRSLWVTPLAMTREIRAFIEASRLDQMAFLLEIEKIYALESKRLADKVWGLSELGQKYEGFAVECERGEKVTSTHKQMFSRLVFGDPLLPPELLPEGFARGKAMRAYRDLLGRSELTL
ncbi:MAG: hypothetical protein HYS86_04270 [Candidatus Chisholmbacteria bacterium]|nr:hypothetical protein [Candidatus Chisholmbacteria bacterium]